MKHAIFFFLCFISFGVNAQAIKRIERAHINDSLWNKGQKMPKAWYEQHYTDTVFTAFNQSNTFAIWVDTNAKATNFITQYEVYLRKQAIQPDTIFMAALNTGGWANHTIKEKLDFIQQEMVRSKQKADSIHVANNQNQKQVWVMNNTRNVIAIPMQDASYICVLQALNTTGQWVTTQYWAFSKCGNSYHDKIFHPQSANYFIANIPDQGDVETKMRFKLLGTDQFYYSNEFMGKLNLIDFVKAK